MTNSEGTLRSLLGDGSMATSAARDLLKAKPAAVYFLILGFAAGE
jgi:hypothetical protein